MDSHQIGLEPTPCAFDFPEREMLESGWRLDVSSTQRLSQKRTQSMSGDAVHKYYSHQNHNVTLCSAILDSLNVFFKHLFGRRECLTYVLDERLRTLAGISLFVGRQSRRFSNLVSRQNREGCDRNSNQITRNRSTKDVSMRFSEKNGKSQFLERPDTDRRTP